MTTTTRTKDLAPWMPTVVVPSQKELVAAQARLEGALFAAGATSVGIGSAHLVITVARRAQVRTIEALMQSKEPRTPYTVEVRDQVVAQKERDRSRLTHRGPPRGAGAPQRDISANEAPAPLGKGAPLVKS